MDRRIIIALLAALCLVVLLSCSQVFEAGISGTVVTKDGTRDVAVSNVNVFAYTDKGLRDSDFAKFQAGTIKRPSEGSGYVASTTTNANGEFVVNKIVWETKKSEFGKTADVNKLYLIFYHEDYTPASYDATIISGSTNQSNVYVNLAGNKDYATLTVTIYNISTGRVMNDAATMGYTVGTGERDTTIITGTGSISVKFTKGSTPNIVFDLASPGTKWEMVDSTGALISSLTVPSVGAGTTRVNLYMKNYEFVMPGFSGDIDGTTLPYDDDSKDAVDNVPVWLAYYGTDNNWHPIVETIDANTKTYATRITASPNIFYTHGEFSGVGDSRDIIVNEDTFPLITNWNAYVGENLTVKLGLFTGNYHDAANYDGFSFYYTPGVSNTALGHVILESLPVL